MSYTQSGFDKFLYKISITTTTGEQTEDATSQYITYLSGSNVSGGTMISQDGKMSIDWDNGRIVISDGAYPRIVIGQVD